MRIPEIQSELFMLAEQHKMPRLAELANELYRRRGRRNSPVISRKITDELEAQIKSYIRLHPSQSQMQVARHFNVNAGRISEIVRGKRK